MSIDSVVQPLGPLSLERAPATTAALAPDEIVRAGVVQVPQGRRLFGALTVRENLLMGAYLRRDREVASDLERVLSLLPRLKERFTFLAGRLSGGEQQQVAIARALMARPKVLLIDEMSLGLAPYIVTRLMQVVREAADEQGVGVVLVEQHVQEALRIADRVCVVAGGRMTLTGNVEDVVDNVESAFLADVLGQTA